MTYKERIETCRTCNNKKVVMGEGIYCALTDALPNFEGQCSDYSPNKELVEKENKKLAKLESANKGKYKLIRVLSILLILGISSIIFSFLTFREFNTGNLLKVGIRTGFEIIVYYQIFVGRKWAKTLLMVLLGLGILFTIISVLSLIGKYPYLAFILIFALIHGYVIYQLATNTDINNWIDVQSMEN